jgi:hypothetical protein
VPIAVGDYVQVLLNGNWDANGNLSEGYTQLSGGWWTFSVVLYEASECRIFIIPIESRAYTIPAEDRVYEIPAESRVFTIACEQDLIRSNT